MASRIKVIITGATGMVGEGVLQECIANEKDLPEPITVKNNILM